jgi:hypothetical protein
MTITDWIQATAMVVLVCATIFYAWQTRRTVREMELQRLAAKPVVIPDINIRFGQTFVEYSNTMMDLAQGDFPVILTNVGTATAIELELSLKLPQNDFISTKLPLLLPGASWKSNLSYVSDFDKAGEPIFGLPPPEGHYELKATSRSSDSPQRFEITLPFDLHCSKGGAFWRIKRDKIYYKLLEAT